MSSFPHDDLNQPEKLLNIFSPIRSISSHPMRIWTTLDSNANATSPVWNPKSASASCAKVHAAAYELWSLCFGGVSALRPPASNGEFTCIVLTIQNTISGEFLSLVFEFSSDITTNECVYWRGRMGAYLSDILFPLLHCFALSHLFEQIVKKEIPSHKVLTCYCIKTKLFNNGRARLAIGLRRRRCICFPRWVSNL